MIDPTLEPRIVSEQIIPKDMVRVLGREVLFHGVTTPFILNKDPAMQAKIQRADDGGATAGFGLYLTDRREAAEHYSRVRQDRLGSEPVIMEFSAEGAKMLDLRNPYAPERNQSFPRPLAEEWLRFLTERYGYITLEEINAGLKNPDKDAEMLKRGRWMHYKYIENLFARKKAGDFDLRELLGSGKDGLYSIGGPLSLDLGEFIQSIGLDGVIYNEGGEVVNGIEGGEGTSFVFFNVKKVEERK